MATEIAKSEFVDAITEMLDLNGVNDSLFEVQVTEVNGKLALIIEGGQVIGDDVVFERPEFEVLGTITVNFSVTVRADNEDHAEELVNELVNSTLEVRCPTEWYRGTDSEAFDDSYFEAEFDDVSIDSVDRQN